MRINRKIRAFTVGSLAVVAGVAGLAASSTTASAASVFSNPIQMSFGSAEVVETGAGLNQAVRFGFNNNTADEKWRVEYTGAKVNGKVEFRLRNKGNGQCLGTISATAAAKIQTRDCTLSNTRWYLGGDHSSAPKPLVMSGTNLVVTRFVGAQLQQYNGGSNQHVKIKVLYGQTA